MSTVTCSVCGAAAAKYKCPRCRLPYCSVACYKTHQESRCSGQPPAASDAPAPLPAQPAPASEPSAQDDAGPVVDEAALAKLGTSSELRERLADPAVRSAVRSILQSPKPLDALASALDPSVPGHIEGLTAIAALIHELVDTPALLARQQW